MERLFKKYSLYLVTLCIIVFLFTTMITFSYYKNKSIVTKDYKELNLNNINNLMIVSHPGDETIFGGAHLIEDNYLVVCISCGKNEPLTNKFIEVVTKTNDEYLLLSYNEYNKNTRVTWEETKLKEDLSNIVKLKNWSTIVTHNKDGEYGNIHHKLTSKVVTKLSNKANLYYFGKYYNKKTIVNYYDELPLINKNTLNKKIKLIGTYKQDYLETSFSHIYEYEKWLSYKEWTE